MARTITPDTADAAVAIEAQHGNEEALAALLQRLDRLILREAGRLARGTVSADDLAQEARLGVVEDLPQYDPSKSTPSTFFYPGMRRRMMAYLSEQGFSVRIPRRQVERYMTAVRESKGDPETAARLAVDLKMSSETFTAVSAVLAARSIDAPGAAQSFESGLPITDPEAVAVERADLAAVLSSLPANVRHVLAHLAEGLTPEETADALGISVKTVYNLRSQARQTVSGSFESAGG